MLKPLRDLQLERNINRSQNRIKSYHPLRAAVAKVGAKAEFTGKNDLETEISNQCGRLCSNAIVFYNSTIRSRLLKRLKAEANDQGIEALTRISPVTWQHILLNGHDTCHSSNEIIGLDALVAKRKLEYGKILNSGLESQADPFLPYLIIDIAVSYQITVYAPH